MCGCNLFAKSPTQISAQRAQLLFSVDSSPPDRPHWTECRLTLQRLAGSFGRSWSSRAIRQHRPTLPSEHALPGWYGTCLYDIALPMHDADYERA